MRPGILAYCSIHVQEGAVVTVTLVTKDATLDDLSASDYRDIYTELRRLDMEPKERISFDRFIAMIGSQYSKAQWAKYDSGETSLNRTMRSELRVATGLPPLPPTVAEATAQASPDASVWNVGDGVPEHVIMVSDSPVTLYVNGSVQTVAPESHVTEVTRARRIRKPCVRVWIPEAQNDRLLRIRDGLGDLTWREVQDAGLKYYERMLKGKGEPT